MSTFHPLPLIGLYDWRKKFMDNQLVIQSFCTSFGRNIFRCENFEWVSLGLKKRQIIFQVIKPLMVLPKYSLKWLGKIKKNVLHISMNEVPFNVFRNCFLRMYCKYRRKEKAALIRALQVFKLAEVYSVSHYKLFCFQISSLYSYVWKLLTFPGFLGC